MNRAALIVIDVQESFRAAPDLGGRAPTRTSPTRSTAWSAHARAEGDLVVWVLHSEPGTGGACSTRPGPRPV